MLQLREKGEEADEMTVLAQLRERDKNDSERALAPLTKAEDAVVIDTTGISVEQVASAILENIRIKR